MFYFVLTTMEIGRDASPKYRCWYCIVDNFDGLPVEEVVSIFLHDWVVCVPLLEIDVNVVIDDFMCVVDRGRGCGHGCGSFPFG